MQSEDVLAAAEAEQPRRIPAGTEPRRSVWHWRLRWIGIALAAVLVAGTALVATDPARMGGAAGSTAAGGVDADVTPTGRVTRAAVTAQHMRFSASTVSVPVGNELVLEVTNTDTHPHDLTLDNGARSGRLAAGQSTNMNIGVVGHDLRGWCAVSSHRQAGMTFQVTVTGLSAGSGSASAGGSGHEQP